MLYLHCERVRATEHTPRDPFVLLEHCHGLAEIVECGVLVVVERLRVSPPHPQRKFMRRPKDTSRHGHYFAQQRLGFFEAL